MQLVACFHLDKLLLVNHVGSYPYFTICCLIQTLTTALVCRVKTVRLVWTVLTNTRVSVLRALQEHFAKQV